MAQIENHRFSILLVVILAMLWIPLARESPVGGFLLQASVVVGLLASVYALSDRRHPAISAAVLAFITLALRYAASVSNEPIVGAAAGLASILFFGFVAVVLLGIVLRTEDITPDTIAGGIAVYLLFGVCFTFAYVTVEQIAPGSLRYADGGLLEVSAKTIQNDLAQVVYFSFVTLSTLGYGDIVPVSPLIKHLSFTEAVIGQLYVAVLIGRLVGMNIGRNSVNASTR